MSRTYARLLAAAVATLSSIAALHARADPPADALDPVEAPRGPSGMERAEAADLLKFAPFVEWPDAAPPDGGVFPVCIVGPDPFGADLDRAAAGQSVDERPIVVRRLETAQKAAGCRILYLSGSAQAVADAVKAVKGAPILTVAEGQGLGAVIGFVQRDQRVRFVIDIHAAADNNLKISSKLLSLALDVQPRKP